MKSMTGRMEVCEAPRQVMQVYIATLTAFCRRIPKKNEVQAFLLEIGITRIVRISIARTNFRS
jgi:hypothetical protein